MKLWALWHGPANAMRLVALYESRDDAQREKDQLMNEAGKKAHPPSCSVIEMDTIPARASE